MVGLDPSAALCPCGIRGCDQATSHRALIRAVASWLIGRRVIRRLHRKH